MVGASASLRTSSSGPACYQYVRQGLADDQTKFRIWNRSKERPLVGGASAHAGVELAWVREGSAHYRIGSTEFDLMPGCFAVIPASLEHETTLSRSMSCIALDIDQTKILELIEGYGNAWKLPVGRIECSRTSTHLLRALEIELEASVSPAANDLSERDCASAIVESILRDIGFSNTSGNERDTAQSKLSPTTRRAIDYIHERVGNAIRVEDIARAAGASRFHFSRSFRQETGKSPYSYVLSLRVQKAATLLRSGATSTQAAYEAGFSDLGRFARAFRQETGVRPSEYARKKG